MADSQKLTILEALKTALDGAAGITTVVIANDRIDMNLQSPTNLPLALIVPTEESVAYETAFQAMWFPLAVVSVFFAGNDEDYEDRQIVRQGVLNAIGADYTLGGTCADCRVQSIVSAGMFPLWEEIFTFQILFEGHRANA